MAGTVLDHQTSTLSRAVIVPQTRTRRVPLSMVIRFGILTVASIIWIVPIAWMLMTSLKPEHQIITYPPKWFPDDLSDLTLANYDSVLFTPRAIDLLQSFRISLMIATIGTILTVTVDVLAGYVFARMRFPLRGPLFALVVASLIVPSEILLIPNYITIWKLGWLNDYKALIIPPVAGAFGVFLMRQFMLGIPGELEDAARLDGAGRLRILWTVILPLSRGPIAALAIFTYLGYWNEFTWPYIIMNQADKMPLPVALLQFRSDYFSEYGLLMAGATVSAAPAVIIFLVAQRAIIRSITLTGVKG